jgi:hypothetical protein
MYTRYYETLKHLGNSYAAPCISTTGTTQQGHESRQRIHELFLSSLHLLRGPRFHDIPNATLDLIPYIFRECGEPVCYLSYRRACGRCVRPHRPVRPQCLLMLLCKHACCTSRSFPRPRRPCRCWLRERDDRDDRMVPLLVPLTPLQP